MKNEKAVTSEVVHAECGKRYNVLFKIIEICSLSVLNLRGLEHGSFLPVKGAERHIRSGCKTFVPKVMRMI